MATLTRDPDGIIRQDGQTPAEWLADFFEFEYCAECGHDKDRHEVTLSPLGHFFAKCANPILDYLDTEKEIDHRLSNNNPA